MPILLALLLFAFGPARAASLNRNEAQIRWKVSETAHFRINYPEELEPVAAYVAGIAEGQAEDKMKRYNFRLPGKVELIVRDDVFSNGWANSLENTMNIWVTDWEIPFRSTHTWLRDVVTHEFSHLVSIQSGSKLPSFFQGLLVGYQSFYNARAQGVAATIIPFTGQPDWFAEGVAQYESSHSGFDAWDSHRDMILRVAALNDSLLGYERMGTFTGNGLQYEQGPYTQGFAFVRYLADRYGDPAVIKLWAENARIHRQTLSGAMETTLGKDGGALWEDWKNAITARYGEQVKGLGKQVAGLKVTAGGFYNYYPRWSRKGDSVFFISNRGRDDFKGSLWSFKPADSGKKEEDRCKSVSGGLHSYFDVAPDDSTFVFHSAKEEDSDAMHKFDIYQAKLKRKAPFLEWKDPTRKRFTKWLNAIEPSYSRDGKRIAFVRAKLTNFYLCTAPVPEGKELDPDEVRTVFPSDSLLAAFPALGGFGFGLFSPRFSPDGKRILFSYFDGASRDIGLVDTDGTHFRPVLARPWDERDPDWAPDGKSFYFSSDSNGIYNLYRYTFATDSAGDRVEALTNVAGGAFCPAVSPDGKRLAYSGYDKDGFSLYLLPAPRPLSLAPAPARGITHDTARIEPIDLSAKAQRYQGLPTRAVVTPMVFGEESSTRTRLATEGVPKWLAGANLELNDPVDKNEIEGSALLQVGKGFDYFGANPELLNPDKESELYLGFRNHSLPVSLGASFARSNITTSDSVTFTSRQDDRDSVARQDYAVTLRDVQASAAYELFDANAVSERDKSNYVEASAGYAWDDFNFFQLPFAFTYYQDTYLSGLLRLSAADFSDKGEVAPQGAAAFLAYTYDRAQLMRNGTFQETFTFSNGVLSPLYRDYDLHQVNAGASLALPAPWTDRASLLLSAYGGSIVSWKAANAAARQADTLDDFFDQGLFLRGYPYLSDIEHLAFRGANTAKLSADFNHPLLPDIYRGAWIVFLQDLYGDVFAEAGRAWDGSPFRTRLLDRAYWDPGQHRDAWYASLGWGLKLNAKIYHNYPFLAFFEAATALDPVPARDSSGGLREQSTIKLGGLDTFATRIRFGVTFGLDNGLLGMEADRRDALHPWRRKPMLAGGM